MHSNAVTFSGLIIKNKSEITKLNYTGVKSNMNFEFNMANYEAFFILLINCKCEMYSNYS